MPGVLDEDIQMQQQGCNENYRSSSQMKMELTKFSNKKSDWERWFVLQVANISEMGCSEAFDVPPEKAVRV